MGTWTCGIIAALAFGAGYSLRWLQGRKGGRVAAEAGQIPEFDCLDTRIVLARAWREFCQGLDNEVARGSAPHGRT
jgi:hypothetical protein